MGVIRIIKNNPEFSLVRLAQIAYNIGQLSNHIDTDNLFDGEPRTYFYTNRLNQLGSYIQESKCYIKIRELEVLGHQLDEKINILKEQTDE